MPAKDFLDKFTYDKDSFDFEKFKAGLNAELDTDTNLSDAKITALTESNTALTANERDLKVKLFDATMMKTGTPVAPTDSPSQGSGGPAPAVPEDAIFKKVQ